MAKLLESLAEAGCVTPFYKGKIAEAIAAAFKAKGGLITMDDLAAYKTVEVEPSFIEWNGYKIYTPPPTAGGLTALQTLNTLKALGWPN